MDDRKHFNPTLTPSGELAVSDSSVSASKERRTLAGCPTRTTRTPHPARPATTLSTAALVSAVARMGRPSGRPAEHSTRMRASRVRVLPVPGGPYKAHVGVLTTHRSQGRDDDMWHACCDTDDTVSFVQTRLCSRTRRFRNHSSCR